MGPEVLVAALALCAVVAYAVLGGADFGGGVWDAFASGERKREQREAISRAMGPVWEANHVWLIFVIVLLFSGFPPAFATLSIELFVPFHLVLVGITLRGAAFVFRAYSPQSSRSMDGGDRRFGAVFAGASVVTPMLLGACLGAVSEGVQGGESGGVVWLSPFTMAMGLLAVGICAYVAAVYLANETSGALREDFRRRALLSGTVVVALSVGLLLMLPSEAPHLWHGLGSPRALPVVAVGAVAALASGWFLRTRRFRAARIATVAQVAGLIGGWGLAQYPYIVHPDVTITSAAAPSSTLYFLLWSTPFGMALLVPSLVYLFRVFKSS